MKYLLIFILVLTATSCVAPNVDMNDIDCEKNKSHQNNFESRPTLIIQPKAALNLTCRVTPEYPKALWYKGVEGVVALIFDITPEGRPINIRVNKSGSQREFEASAISAMERSLFKPSDDGYKDQRYVYNFSIPKY